MEPLGFFFVEKLTAIRENKVNFQRNQYYWAVDRT
jgi:hypothetical protein